VVLFCEQRLKVMPHPPADINGRAGDIAGAAGAEEGDHPGDLVGLAEAAQGDIAAGHRAEEDVAALLRGAALVDAHPLGAGQSHLPYRPSKRRRRCSFDRQRHQDHQGALGSRGIAARHRLLAILVSLAVVVSQVTAAIAAYAIPLPCGRRWPGRCRLRPPRKIGESASPPRGESGKRGGVTIRGASSYILVTLLSPKAR